MSDALERVREDSKMWSLLSNEEDDLHAVCAELERLRAELTALRGARSWERWAVDNGHGEVHDTFTTKDEAKHYLWNPGERVIRVRITEIPEDGQ